MEKKAYGSLFTASLKDAGEILSRDGHRLTLVMSLLFFLLSAAPYFLLKTAAELLFAVLPLTQLAGEILLALLVPGLWLLHSLLVVLPLWQGYMALAVSMAEEGEADPHLLLSAFSGKTEYRRALSGAWAVLWRMGLVALSVLAVYLYAAKQYADSPLHALVSALVIILLVLLGLCWCLSLYGMGYFGARHRRMPWRTVRKQTRELLSRSPLLPLRFAFYFLPRILLGLLTLGIYLVADLVPRMALCAICDCRDRETLFTKQTVTISEEIEKHE